MGLGNNTEGNPGEFKFGGDPDDQPKWARALGGFMKGVGAPQQAQSAPSAGANLTAGIIENLRRRRAQEDDF